MRLRSFILLRVKVVSERELTGLNGSSSNHLFSILSPVHQHADCQSGSSHGTHFVSCWISVSPRNAIHNMNSELLMLVSCAKTSVYFVCVEMESRFMSWFPLCWVLLALLLGVRGITQRKFFSNGHSPIITGVNPFSKGLYFSEVVFLHCLLFFCFLLPFTTEIGTGTSVPTSRSP